MLDRIHADAIAQQRAAGFAPRRVDGNDRDLELVVLIHAEAADQLVGERRFARAARAGDPQDGRLRRFCRAQQFVAQLRRHCFGFESRDEAREGSLVAGLERAQIFRQFLSEVDVAGRDDLVDHPLQAQPLAVLGREDARNAVFLQLVDLGRDDHPAAAAEDSDVGSSALAQKIQHVFEELDVAALIRRDGDAVRVLLQRGRDDVLDRAVVAEMDHLAAGRLEDAAHDIDRRVVAVEQARGGDKAHLVGGPGDRRFFGDGDVVHRWFHEGANARKRARAGGKAYSSPAKQLQ